jgi:hypothetical protein
MPGSQPPAPEIYDWRSLPLPPDYPQDTPARRRIQPWWWLWFRGGILVVILVMLSFLLGRLTAPPSHAAGSSHTITRTLTTVRTFSGSGSALTDDFVVHTAWQINWLCVPNVPPKSPYLFKIDMNNADTFTPVSTATDQLCETSSFSSVVKETQTGHFYLFITSKGSWAIEIQVFQ